MNKWIQTRTCFLLIESKTNCDTELNKCMFEKISENDMLVFFCPLLVVYMCLSFKTFTEKTLINIKCIYLMVLFNLERHIKNTAFLNKLRIELNFGVLSNIFFLI